MLLYFLEIGESEASILKQVAQDHSPVPERIKNAPELEIGLEFVYNTFFRLSTQRSIGMGAGPIPWCAMNDFAKAHGMDDDEQSDLEYLIGKMDEVYLKHMQKKAEARKEFDRTSAQNSRKALGTKLRERRG